MYSTVIRNTSRAERRYQSIKIVYYFSLSTLISETSEISGVERTLPFFPLLSRILKPFFENFRFVGSSRLSRIH